MIGGKERDGREGVELESGGKKGGDGSGFMNEDDDDENKNE